MLSADDIIKLLDLKPHLEEGGYFAETYRSGDKINKEALPEQYHVDKHLSTAIYFLLTPDCFSTLHRLQTDEIFHFYLGDPVTMLQLYPDGSSKTFVMGNDIANGQHVQLVVPKNVWQGSFLNEGGRFVLMGTTMSPGFDYSDYEPGNRDSLIKQYPGQAKLIAKLTRE